MVVQMGQLAAAATLVLGRCTSIPLPHRHGQQNVHCFYRVFLRSKFLDEFVGVSTGMDWFVAFYSNSPACLAPSELPFNYLRD